MQCSSCRHRRMRSCGLRLYQQQTHGLVPDGPDDSLWWTLRRPFRPLNYHAARAMFVRANESAGIELVASRPAAHRRLPTRSRPGHADHRRPMGARACVVGHHAALHHPDRRRRHRGRDEPPSTCGDRSPRPNLRRCSIARRASMCCSAGGRGDHHDRHPHVDTGLADQHRGQDAAGAVPAPTRCGELAADPPGPSRGRGSTGRDTVPRRRFAHALPPEALVAGRAGLAGTVSRPDLAATLECHRRRPRRPPRLADPAGHRSRRRRADARAPGVCPKGARQGHDSVDRRRLHSSVDGLVDGDLVTCADSQRAGRGA